MLPAGGKEEIVWGRVTSKSEVPHASPCTMQLGQIFPELTLPWGRKDRKLKMGADKSRLSCL